LLNGTKQWISNSPHADAAFVFAVTDFELRSQRRGGITCFYVPMSTPGVSVDSVIRVYGEHGGNEGIVSFVDVEVGPEQLVGRHNQGFQIAMSGISNGRIFNAGRCVGLARWALERAIEYASERKTFGHPLIDNQGVAFPIADSATEIYAARCLALDCARKLDSGQRARMELAMAKSFCSETCYRTYDRAMQVHGAMGLTNEMKLYNGWHQARTQRIADGSAEIMRRLIVAELRRGEMPF
jgi:acyl-CoA dehydrogenase